MELSRSPLPQSPRSPPMHAGSPEDFTVAPRKGRSFADIISSLDMDAVPPPPVQTATRRSSVATGSTRRRSSVAPVPTFHIPPSSGKAGHVKKLKEYTAYRRAQEYDEMLSELSYRSSYLFDNKVQPCLDVWNHLLPHSGSAKRNAVSTSSLRIKVPPTLVHRPSDPAHCIFTNDTGYMCRADNVTASFFKSLLTPPADAYKGVKWQVHELPDISHSWSSAADASHVGRLQSPVGWQAENKDASQWYQLDMGEETMIGGIAIKGHGAKEAWVTSLTVLCSADAIAWSEVDNGKTYPGNTDSTSLVRIHFMSPVSTRYLRLKAKTCHGAFALRVGVLIKMKRKKRALGESTKAVEIHQYPVAVLKRQHTDSNSNDVTVLLAKQAQEVVENTLSSGGDVRAGVSSSDPYVIQEFVRPKGQMATIYRCVWRLQKGPYMHQISNRVRMGEDRNKEGSFIVSQDTDIHLCIFTVKGPACSEIANLSLLLAKSLAGKMRPPVMFEQFVTDWIHAADGTWWLIQVKGWKTREASRSPFAQSVPSHRHKGDGSKGTSKKSQPQTCRMVRCAMCREQFTHLECTMTESMIHECLRLIRRRQLSGPLRKLRKARTASERYQISRVCKGCFQLYKEQDSIHKAESSFTKVMGLPAEGTAARPRAIEASPVRVSSPTTFSKERMSAAVRSVALGEALDTGRPSGCLQQWHLLVYYIDLHNLPPEVSFPLFLRMDILGRADVIQIPSSADRTAPIPLNSIRMHHLFTEIPAGWGRESTMQEDGAVELDPAMRRFLEMQQELRIELCSGPNEEHLETLGVARLSLKQFVTGLVQKVEMVRLFSSPKLRLCAVRTNVGVVKGLRLSDPRDGVEVVRLGDGVWIPRTPYFGMETLPLDWREKVVEAYEASRGLQPSVIHSKQPSSDEESTGSLSILEREHRRARKVLRTLKRNRRPAPTEKVEEGTPTVEGHRRPPPEGNAVVSHTPRPPQVDDPLEVPEEEGASGMLSERLRRILAPPRMAFVAVSAMRRSSKSAASPVPSPRHRASAVEPGERPRQAERHQVQINDPRSAAPEPSQAMLAITQGEMMLPSSDFEAWQVDVSVQAIHDLDSEVDETWKLKYTLLFEERTHTAFQLLNKGPLMFAVEDTTVLYAYDRRSIAAYFKGLNGTSRLRFDVSSLHGTTVLEGDVPLGAFERALRQGQQGKIEGSFPLKRVNLLGDELRRHNREKTDALVMEDLSDDETEHIAGDSSQDDGEFDDHCPLITVDLSVTPIVVAPARSSIKRTLRPEFEIAVLEVTTAGHAGHP
eukprot:Sspe_Gene.4210::Locus_1384_Transcript_1_1_Confidence_1.000_Length_4007::g.4210::m.4210